MTKLLFWFFVCALVTPSIQVSQEEANKIFDKSNTDNYSTLEGNEIFDALFEATKRVFEEASYFYDEGLIKELVKQYAQEAKKKLTKDDFNHIFKSLSSFAKTFRENTYTQILKDFEMNEVLSDPSLFEEVLKKPDTYGITYGSHKDAFEEIQRLYQEALDEIKNLQNKFEGLLSETQKKNPEMAENLQETLKKLKDSPKEGFKNMQEIINSMSGDIKSQGQEAKRTKTNDDL